MVTHSLSGGGAERFAATLATHLDRDRFAPRICLATPRADYPVPEEVPVDHLRYRGLADLPRAVLELRRLIAATSPDLVLSNVLATNCLTGAALAGLGSPPPWVARIGNAPGATEPALQRWWARRAYPRARALVCNAEDMRPAFEAAYPGTRGRVLSLPNPTDFARLDRLAAAGPEALSAALPATGPAAAGSPTLLAVGRLTRQKRPELLLEALALVRRRYDARLWLAGEGPLEGDLRRRTAALGVEDAVDFLGFLPNPFPLLRRADLFLLASDFEGLPNALIEAQGLGVAAVATRCRFGPEEIVDDGATGLLVPVGDAAALAAAVHALAADPERRRRMGEAARERARRLYGLEAALPRWQELLAAAAAGPLDPAVFDRHPGGGAGGGAG